MPVSRRTVEARLNRTRGAGEHARERLTTAANGWNDWRGTCIRCGHTRYGHISELSKPCPKCGYGVGAGE